MWLIKTFTWPSSTLELLRAPHLPPHSCYFPEESFHISITNILAVWHNPQSTTWSIWFWILVQFLNDTDFDAHLVKMLLTPPDLMPLNDTPVHFCLQSFLCCLISLLKSWEVHKYAKEFLCKCNFRQCSRVRIFTREAF